MASNESRNPKEFAIETYIIHYHPGRANVQTPLQFKMKVMTAIDDDSKHDTHSATCNLDEVLTRLMNDPRIGTINRVIIMSDGASKEYKSANSFDHAKKLAQKFNIAIFWSFSCTDDGKGLVDAIGSIFHKDYRRAIQSLKLGARFVNKVAS